MDARRRLLPAVLVACAALAHDAAAQTFAVTAEVVPGCAFVGAPASAHLDLGTLNYGVHPAVHAGPLTASTIASGSAPVRLECTPGLELQVSVDAGEHGAGGQRRLGLEGGGALVPYSLFTSAALDTPLPIGALVGIEVPATGVLDLPIHGSLTLPGLGLAPGVYSDTLQVTLTW